MTASKLLAVTALLLLAELPESRAEMPDLSGSWVVDLEESDSLQPILVLLDRTWMERQLASNAKVVNVITQTAESVHVEIDTSFYHETEHLVLDGKWHSRERKMVGKYSTRSFWKNGKLVAENRLTLPDGQKARMTVSRSLDEKTDQLVQTSRLEARGQTLMARRIWRRQAD